MPEYTLDDIERWDAKIKEKVESFGLDPYPQIFELCDYNQMIGYIAYSGMPSRYPHWSFGKTYEKQKTLYELGIAGLPYEMVINSNPCLAYLMVDNSLLLQILTIAHVYAHNDFFKNNFNFQHIRAEFTLEKFKAHADRIRKYSEDPRIGLRKIEPILDAAHSLSLSCRRYASVKKGLTSKPSKPEKNGETHEFTEKSIGLAELAKETDTERVFPQEPEEDILIFIRDNNRKLTEWQKDLLTIVNEESQYFIPQIET